MATDPRDPQLTHSSSGSLRSWVTASIEGSRLTTQLASPQVFDLACIAKAWAVRCHVVALPSTGRHRTWRNNDLQRQRRLRTFRQSHSNGLRQQSLSHGAEGSCARMLPCPSKSPATPTTTAETHQQHQQAKHQRHPEAHQVALLVVRAVFSSSSGHLEDGQDQQHRALAHACCVDL